MLRLLGRSTGTRPLALLRATHPLPSAAVTGFVTALAIAAGVPAGRTAALAAAVLVGQFSVGWANDAIDADRDRLVGRRDKPIAAGEVRRDTVVTAACAALILDVPLSLLVGWRAGAAHLAAVGWAWLYDTWLKSTVLSVVPYVVSFGLAPVVVAAALPSSATPAPVIAAAGACCGVAAHFANTVGDAADDALTGVRGLPQVTGEIWSLPIAAIAVAVAAVLLLAGVGPTPLPIVATVAGVGCAAATPAAAGRSGAGRRLAFRLIIAAVALLVVTFVVAGGHHLTG